MTEINKITVSIGSHEYVLKSVRPEKEMKEIADYVEQQVEGARNRNRHLNDTMQATLAAINICDELFTARKQLFELQETSSEPMQRYEPLKQRAAALESERSVLDANIKEEKSAHLQTKAALDEVTQQKRQLEERLEAQRRSSQEKEQDLQALQKNVEAAEQKLLQMTKQFQEYRRSHQ